jgi:hypothetical protein
MLQAIALAIASFIRFAFDDLTESCMRLVLEEFAPVGNPTEQATADQLPARAGLMPERPRRMAEEATPAED